MSYRQIAREVGLHWTRVQQIVTKGKPPPLLDDIEVFYNRQRLHSGIGYARPVSGAA